jgi:hypothetical protein
MTTAPLFDWLTIPSRSRRRRGGATSTPYRPPTVGEGSTPRRAAIRARLSGPVDERVLALRGATAARAKAHADPCDLCQGRGVGPALPVTPAVHTRRHAGSGMPSRLGRMVPGRAGVPDVDPEVIGDIDSGKMGFPPTNHCHQCEKRSQCHASPDAPDLSEERRSVFDLPLDRRGSARSRSSFALGLRRPGNP